MITKVKDKKYQRYEWQWNGDKIFMSDLFGRDEIETRQKKYGDCQLFDVMDIHFWHSNLFTDEEIINAIGLKINF